MLVYLIGILGIILISILQTNVVGAIEIGGARPDLALLVTVYLANRNGSMVGQVSGFVAGLTQDILSLAPIGFYTLTKTIIGFVGGFTRSNVHLDLFLVPVVMVFLGTLLKGVLFLAIGAIFGVSGPFGSVWSLRFLIELAYNVVLAPVVFGILGLFRGLELDGHARDL